MRRLVWLVPLLVVLTASPAAAAGAGLRWNSCQGESNRNFACDRSTGSELLVGSFSAPASMSMMAAEAYIRITVSEGEVPSWWRMWDTGDCRKGSSSLTVDVSSETDCEDPWLGNATGIYKPHSVDERGIDLWMAIAVPNIAPVSITGERPYSLFKLTVQHTRSSGAGACTGCNTPTCIVLERVVLVPARATMGDGTEDRYVELTEGMSGLGGAGNIVTWQGGTPSCAAGARKSSTWSDLKRRFR